MKKRRIWLVACLLTLAVAMLAAVGCGGGGDKKGVKVTLTVPTVPTSVNVGETVTLPAATATADGKDISDYILVSVDLLKNDSTAVHRSIVHEQPGNATQSFVATDNERLTYKIRYVVEYEGVTEEKAFTLTAIADKEAPVLTLDIEDGAKLTGVGGQSVTLPHATAIDNPGNKDLTARIEARLYEVFGDKPTTSPLAAYSDFTQDKVVRIPSGKYELAYTVSDVAGNQAAQSYRIPVEIAQPGAVNLIKDKSNFAHNNQVGKSWFNERNELAFGNTAPFADFSSAVGWSLNTTKIHQQIVGITFNADPITAKGQWFYTFAARGSKNRESMPTYATSEWPPYMYMRIGSGLEPFAKDNVNMGERAAFGDKKASESGITGGALLNGEDHVMYLQYLNYGTFDFENPENDVTPAILLRGWVDTDPTSPWSFQYSVIPGDKDGWGQLERSTFAMLWEENAAGWLSVSATPQQNTKSDDDHMRIKAVVVYDKDATEFTADITPPKFTISELTEDPTDRPAYDTATVRALNEAFDLPWVTVDDPDIDDEDIKIVLTKPDGTTVTLAYDTETYTPTAEGKYSIMYEVTDAAGNCAYKTIVLTIAEKDDQQPTLTVENTDAITVKVGETVSLSAATATSAKGVDLTADIVVEVKGSEHYFLQQGASFVPKTPGTYTATYRVKNSYGVYADEVVINITVQSTLTPDTNLVGANGLNSSSSTVVLSGAEHIYDQRITTVIKLDTLGLVLLNIRGEDANLNWPDGITLGIFGGGGDARMIALSYNGHNDAHYYANTTFENWTYRSSAEIVLEWQLKTVTVNGKEYLRAQVWVQGETLIWSANGCGQADVKAIFTALEEGFEDGEAAYLAVEDIPANNAENIYSTQFFFFSNNCSTTIKEFYINASAEKRAELLETYPGPQAPDGYADSRTYNSDGSLKTVSIPEATKEIAASADVHLTLATDVNESVMVVSAVRSGGTKNSLAIGITGPGTSSWGTSAGVTILMGNDGFNGGWLTMGGRSSNQISALAWNDDNGALTHYTWAYKLTYVSSGEGYVNAVKLQIWGAQYGKKPEPIGAQVWNDKYVDYGSNFITYDETTKTWTFAAGAFANATQMSPDCSVYNPGSQNDCSWSLEIATLASIDDYVVHQHTFNETEWETDGVGHWHVATCGHSNEKGSYAEHDYDADYKCTVCEYEHTHTYATAWSYDETNHWHVPTCGHDIGNQGTGEHNMVAAGDVQECEVCKYSPHTHTYATTWSKDATYHWKESTCDHPEAIEKVVHTYDENGVCLVCGQEYTTVTVAFPNNGSRNDLVKEISNDVGENYVVVDYTFTLNEATPVEGSARNYFFGMGIILLGKADSVWNGDLLLWASADGYYLKMGGPNGTNFSSIGVGPKSEASGKTYTFVYKATYEYTDNAISAIKLDLWHGEKGKALTKVGGSITAEVEGISYDAASKQYTILPAAATDFKGEFRASSTVTLAGAFNNANSDGRDCSTDWDIKVSLRGALPTASLSQIGNNVSGNYYLYENVTGWVGVSVDYDTTENPTTGYGPGIWINMYDRANIDGSWHCGLTARINRDGSAQLRYGHLNNNPQLIATLDLPTWVKEDGKFTLLYKVTSVTDGIELIMYIGSETHAYVPFVVKGSITAGFADYASFNAETSVWTLNDALDSDTTIALAHTPDKHGDCSVIVCSTFGGTGAFYDVTAKLYAAVPAELLALGTTAKQTLATVEYTQAVADAIAAVKGLPADVVAALGIDLATIEATYKTLSDEKVAEAKTAMEALDSQSADEDKEAALAKFDALLVSDRVEMSIELWSSVKSMDKDEYVWYEDMLWGYTLEKSKNDDGYYATLAANATFMAADLFIEVYYNAEAMKAIDAIPTEEITAENAADYKAALDAADKAYGDFKTSTKLSDEDAQAKCLNYSALENAHTAYDAYTDESEAA